MKRNIVVFSRAFYPNNSGFANAATAWAKCLLQIDNINVIVITTTPMTPNQTELKGVKVLRLNRDGRFLMRALIKICALPLIRQMLGFFKLSWLKTFLAEKEQHYLARPYLSSDNLSMIIFETNVYPFIGPKLSKQYPTKTAMRLHSTEDTEILAYSDYYLFSEKIIKKKVYQFCKECPIILATNSYHLGFFKDKLLENNVFDIWSKIHYDVVPNTVEGFSNLDEIKQLPGLFKKEHKIPEKYCFTLGKLVPAGWVQKGFSDLIKALWLLNENNKLPNEFKLVVVGSGIEEKRFLQMIDKSNLTDYIIHIPKTTRLETLQLLYSSRFVVLPSRFEGQSMFLSEAVMLGKAIITTKDTGSLELVDDKISGVKLEIGNYSDLAEEIIHFWQLDNKTINVMEEAAKQIYKTRFSNKAVTEKTKKILKIISLYE